MLVFFWNWKARKDGGQVFMGEIRDGRKSMRSCKEKKKTMARGFFLKKNGAASQS
jgi:hypothetical protein